MPNEFEMKDLSNTQLPDDETMHGETRDYTVSVWAWTSTTLSVHPPRVPVCQELITVGLLRFFLLASCLILSPRLLLFVTEAVSGTERRTALTPLESFLALQFGVFLLAVSSALVLNVCSLLVLPYVFLSPPQPAQIPSAAPLQAGPHERNAASTHPLLGSVAIASAVASFISYNTTTVGPLALIFFLGSGVVALWGFWVVSGPLVIVRSPLTSSCC